MLSHSDRRSSDMLCEPLLHARDNVLLHARDNMLHTRDNVLHAGPHLLPHVLCASAPVLPPATIMLPTSYVRSPPLLLIELTTMTYGDRGSSRSRSFFFARLRSWRSAKASSCPTTPPRCATASQPASLAIRNRPTCTCGPKAMILAVSERVLDPSDEVV